MTEHTEPTTFDTLDQAKTFVEEYSTWRCDLLAKFKAKSEVLPTALIEDLHAWLNSSNSWLGWIFQERRLSDAQIRALMALAKDVYESEAIKASLKDLALRDFYDVLWFSKLEGWEPKTLDMILGPYKDQINSAFLASAAEPS